MNNYRDIIIRPIITEKSMRYMDEDNKVTFEVAKGTNKIEVARAVEHIFGVDVEKVNINFMTGKMLLAADEQAFDEVYANAVRTIKKFEPSATVRRV